MKLTAVVVLLAFIQIKGQTEILSCGIIGQNLIPLMTNSEPTLRRWPWHTAIYHRLREADQDQIIYKCAGSVISSNSILTAAHCVSKYGVRMKSKDILVSLGRLTLNESESGGRSYEVQQINVHPNFNWENLNNDIAIIRLSVEVQFNTNVHPICLWKTGKTELSEIVGKFGTVVGWGRTELGQISNVLRQASLPVVSWGTCLESNRAFAGNYLTERNFCAGLRNGTSVCDGDSGGSMTFEENGIYSIRGIVSSTPAKFDQTTQKIMCDDVEYAIFTDVAHYLSWIRDTATIIECETIVRCDWSVANNNCKINVGYLTKSCKIVFNEFSNRDVTELSVSGKSDTIPDLFDATVKFAFLESLTMDRNNLKDVERFRLTVFKDIEKLDLSFNQISQLAADTFDDLKNLEKLEIGSNKLREIHVDLFKEHRSLMSLSLGFNKIQMLPAAVFRNNEQIRTLGLSGNRLTELPVDIFHKLRYLESLYLNGNQLENLPSGVFRSNHYLRLIFLDYNNIKTIEFDFSALTKLMEIDDLEYNRIQKIGSDRKGILMHNYVVSINLEGNVCLNENFNISMNRDRESFMEKIQRNCAK